MKQSTWVFKFLNLKAHPVVEFLMKVDIKRAFYVSVRLQKLISFSDIIT